MRILPENKWLRRGIIVTGLLAVWLFFTIDDWSRDLTTNTAELTDSDYPILQERLRLWSPEEAAAGVKMAATRIPSWSWIGDASEGETRLVTFERKSKIFRFKDDITVRIEPTVNRPVVSASSASGSASGISARTRGICTCCSRNSQSSSNRTNNPHEIRC